MDFLKPLIQKLLASVLDIAPVVAVMVFFQLFVIQSPLPDLEKTIPAMLLVVFGLFLFVMGLETALFPMGESLAVQFTRKGNPWWLLLFAFTLGFSTTIAEPALTVIANKAGELAAGSGAIAADSSAIGRFVLGLRLTIAASVGIAIALGVLRIIRGWPLIWFILAGYSLIVVATLYAPKAIIGIAYDSGGITTSTITVPLVTALGVSLAASIRGRNPMTDGFGLIAFASLTPILFVLIYGMAVYGVA